MKKTKLNQRIKEMFTNLKMGFVYDSVIEGHTHGSTYINDNGTLSIFIEGNSIYFGGIDEDLKEYQDTIVYFKENILKLMKEKGVYYVVLKYTDEKWEQLLIKSLNPIQASRVLYQHNLEHIPNLSTDIEITDIDETILSSNMENVKFLKNEVLEMWGSVNAFLDNGFGSCAVVDGKIASWCTAEYMSENQCGIGIETVEAYQNQGIASNVAIALLKQCKERNLIPHWDSWIKNVPSWKVAEKVGFKKIKDHAVLVIELQN